MWFATLHERDDHHDDAQAILAACMDGEHGSVFTTTDVVDETFALILHRVRGNGWGMVQAFGGFAGFTDERPTVATVLEADHALQKQAWPLFDRHYEERGLSFTDCTSLATVRRKGIEKVASFDEGFDGLVERVAE